MNRAYYDCPIQAAYMSKFGVLIGEWHNEEDVFFTKLGWLGQPLGASVKGKYYIHPDSMSVFEPNEGDLGVDEDEEGCKFINDNWSTYGDYGRLYAGDEVQIIMRDNKPFFWPKFEEVDDVKS